MKKALLAMALFAPLAMSAKAPEPINPPATLPQQVSSVSPEQGFVNLAGDQSPQGVSEIAVTFKGSPDLQCVKGIHAQLYKEGEFIAESIDAQKDMMFDGIGAVRFNQRKYTQPGWYEVRIPAGMWLLGEEGPESPEMTLFYEIYNSFSVEPTPGVVDIIEEVVLRFPDGDEIELTDKAQGLNLSVQGSTTMYEVIPMIEDHAVYFKFGSDGIAVWALIDPATYMLEIPEGAVKFKTYGPNYPTDPEDYVERTNDAVLCHYTIPAFPQPAIVPEPGEVKEFLNFVITIDDNFEFGYADNMTFCHIFPVNANGTIDTNYIVYKAKVTNDDPVAKTVTITLIDNTTGVFYTEPATPLPGDYCLRLGNVFAGTWNGNWENCPAFDYFYTVPEDSSAVEALDTAEADTYTVYDFSGILVGKNLNVGQLNALPKGLYIVNGKKILK